VNEFNETPNDVVKPAKMAVSSKILTFLIMILFLIIGAGITLMIWNNQNPSEKSIADQFYQSDKPAPSTAAEPSASQPADASSENASSTPAESSAATSESSTAESSSSSAQSGTYTVQAGDYLSSIAAKTGHTAEEIAAANGHTVSEFGNGWTIYPGEELKLP
jgi:LysM repeat protein